MPLHLIQHLVVNLPILFFVKYYFQFLNTQQSFVVLFLMPPTSDACNTRSFNVFSPLCLQSYFQAKLHIIKYYQISLHSYQIRSIEIPLEKQLHLHIVFKMLNENILTSETLRMSCHVFNVERVILSREQRQPYYSSYAIFCVEAGGNLQTSYGVYKHTVELYFQSLTAWTWL